MFLQCLYMSFAVSITIMAVTMIVKKTQHKDYVSVSLVILPLMWCTALGLDSKAEFAYFLLMFLTIAFVAYKLWRSYGDYEENARK